ncbi:MAG: hypothetical protein HN704_08745 [Bacteroidetes bacterium]|jgi:hypothetical protein|nr:hypothetical protein [Bacteroidota bacterium]MBT6687501.1 hypothetical protein [Bacteroidota bacterium]MBT7142989.1 hypothetical protein [Bacteroidota bacterium]MBT7491679.1 hypothetical protein [Bacteroidota bacterium]
MKKLFTTLSIVLLFSSIFSQEKADEFKPSGKPFIKVFTNYHHSFYDGDGHSAFEVQRAYLGYAYKLSKNFSGKVTIDVGDPGDSKFQMTAYLKTAYVQYKGKRLTTKFGLIGRNQFKLQEKQWGGRYLFKSFQDKNKFGASTDLGLSASYKLNEMTTIDVAIENGEGYKSLEKDSIFKYSAGITLSPLKGLDVRGYYDFMRADDAQSTMSFYVGYSKAKLKVGAEYNQQFNYSRTADQDMSGMSFYGSYNFQKFRLFGRFDQLSSVKIGDATDPWNIGKDGETIIAGIEFSPIKGLKVTPNYQVFMPADGGESESILYLSCEIKF